jgi:hypothetical protein
MPDVTKTAKTIVEDVLSTSTARDVWTANYFPALPFTPNGFELSSLMPAVFYMFRTGKRRGKGRFHETYGLRKEAIGTKVRRAGSVSVENIAETLSRDTESITGFSSEVGRAILGDALLAFCFENRNHEPGRGKQVQRALPTHYFASWIDLPDKLVDLRYVPEALVAILIDQKRGHAIELIKERTRFGLINSNDDVDANDLVMPFASGLSIGTFPSDLKADDFDESASVGIDQLLTIRSARLCGERPAKIRNSKEELDVIANRRPIVTRAAAHLREDISVLLQVFGTTIPRKALLPMLEAGFGLGLTNVLLSTATSLFEWERRGTVPNGSDEYPWPLFVDASSGSDFEIRRLSEECCFDLAQRFDRLPIILMALRIIDAFVRYGGDIEDAEELRRQPTANEWLNLLGEIMQGRHTASPIVERDLRRSCKRLAEALRNAEEAPEIATLLEDQQVSPVWRIAESVVALMGRGAQQEHFGKCLDSCLMTNEPHGLARKRKVVARNSETGRSRTADVRSIVLSNTMLDLLVHRHLFKAANGRNRRSLSLQEFLTVLRKHYGLHVDRSPEGMSIPTDLLARNRSILERRLRDLGLLIGVSDAESMKRLQPRFEATEAK